ncbi:MAG: SDR family NAD(P)-dependent oxidoreductase [Clostridiaceae bacterium]|nr:SDR family NAD(P)-dependent oxidoreductase [Clostridiaceae bacterium]
MRFMGKVAIVTGAGSARGIGRETSLLLAKEGALVVVADMNFEGAKSVAREVEALGGTALPVQVDITDEASVKAMVEATVAKYGRLDILVNNAGITQPVTTMNMTPEDFMRIIKVNLYGTFLCSKMAAPEMAKNHYGRIVSLSSVSGKRGGGVFGGSHYSAAKAGILGFSKAFAREVVNDGITVNCVCPGLVDTDIRAGISDEAEHEIWTTIPMKRPASTREIASTIAFLASDEASYITGEDIDINGGSHMD